MGKNKILILVPHIESAQGGISNYYFTLKEKFSNNIYYFTRGSREWPYKKNILIEFLRIISDYISFFIKLIINNYKLVQTTTSFTKFSLVRDGIFILITKLLNRKVIVFFRGWNDETLNRVEKRYLRLFKFVYFKSDAIIDLAKQNIITLQKWGYRKPIYLETTVVDENLVSDITEEFIKEKYDKTNDLRILFLSRLETIKGIYIALDAYLKIKKELDSKISFIIAGDGKEIDNVKEYLRNKGVKNVSITGFIKGENKKDTLKKSHIYIFPTMFGEGMSNSILEALACGLPVITRPVGGNADILTNEVTGFVLESTKYMDYYNCLKKLITHPPLMLKMALYNYNYAKEKFYASKVVSRIETIFSEVISQ